jgi:hypothetical protein
MNIDEMQNLPDHGLYTKSTSATAGVREIIVAIWGKLGSVGHSRGVGLYFLLETILINAK